MTAWQQDSGYRPGFYTWLTDNLYWHPKLMEFLHRAGFHLLFIDIMSFGENSLLETARQKLFINLAAAVSAVQSYGFIFVAGSIYGFVSDDEYCFELTRDGLRESGLLSGDTSSLTALPGGPLHRCMKLADRSRQVRYGLGGFKYMMPADFEQTADEPTPSNKTQALLRATGQKLRAITAETGIASFPPKRGEA